ncbi:hypothetical protein L218DRAFT_223522 [Marasmius fiardii PR-910]|nr:hypothetical protein L218DRAFT_223522 [Marasmius fiardii PR-910]
MPKLATSLRRSTKQLYSNLDSEGPRKHKSKRTSSENLKELEDENKGNRRFITGIDVELEDEEQLRPRCSHSPNSRPLHLSTFGTRSGAPDRTTESEVYSNSLSDSGSESTRSRRFLSLCTHPFRNTTKLHRTIRQSFVKPIQDIKSRVHGLQVQTRRKCRRLRTRADSFWGRTMEIALGPWQVVQGFLYGLLLVCLGIAEILFSIIFTIIYKVLKVVVTSVLIPIIIITAIANALKCQ